MRNSTRSKRKNPVRPLARGRFLYLERLEDRWAPATVNWTGAGDRTSWGDARNWDSLRVPGPGDDVVLNDPSTTAVVHASGNDAINSLTSQNNLTLSGGTLSVAHASTIGGHFTLTGGTFSGAGDLTITGPWTWSGGTMGGSGTTTAQGGLTLSGGIRFLDGRTLANPGAAAWTAGDLYLADGAVLANAGTLDDQSGNSVVWYTGAQPTFTNAGTFRVQAASNTSVSTAFTNSGTLDLRGGALALSSGGTLGGPVQGDASSSLRFNGGSYTVPLGAQLVVPTVVFAGATVDVQGTYDAGAATQVSGGTATFEPSATLTSLGQLVTVSSGTANLPAGTPLTLPALAVSGGT